tara:strand:+ start:36073 stop:36372 length:300 start_codon:yes stop_codon:yes gene_type:complete
MERHLKPVDRECITRTDFADHLRNYLTNDRRDVDYLAHRMFVETEVTPLAVHLNDYDNYSRQGQRHNVIFGKWKYHNDKGLFVRFGDGLSWIKKIERKN